MLGMKFDLGTEKTANICLYHFSKQRRGTDLKLLIYTGKGDTSRKSIATISNDFTQRDSIEVYNTPDDLLKRLQVPRGNLDLILLLIDNQKDLEDLILLKNMFFNMPIVIVLPDRKKMTIRQGLKFYPRYIGYADSSLKDVTAVLKKITNTIR